ncbi:hypothetical protein IF1G_06433 [Cordyceps javanica]|uniref:Uncharacterized protein n=1 Tax=Cordyceps javanica TaxID=43265 RepID=A0A545V162_9HYPO|nr:hypothetical protein IF1G_06433 [Cordyceps javanica]
MMVTVRKGCVAAAHCVNVLSSLQFQTLLSSRFREGACVAIRGAPVDKLMLYQCTEYYTVFTSEVEKRRSLPLSLWIRLLAVRQGGVKSLSPGLITERGPGQRPSSTANWELLIYGQGSRTPTCTPYLACVRHIGLRGILRRAYGPKAGRQAVLRRVP